MIGKSLKKRVLLQDDGEGEEEEQHNIAQTSEMEWHHRTWKEIGDLHAGEFDLRTKCKEMQQAINLWNQMGLILQRHFSE